MDEDLAQARNQKVNPSAGQVDVSEGLSSCGAAGKPRVTSGTATTEWSSLPSLSPALLPSRELAEIPSPAKLTNPRYPRGVLRCLSLQAAQTQTQNQLEQRSSFPPLLQPRRAHPSPSHPYCHGETPHLEQQEKHHTWSSRRNTRPAEQPWPTGPC